MPKTTPANGVAKLLKAQVCLAETLDKIIKTFQNLTSPTTNMVETIIEHTNTVWTRFSENHFTIYENENNDADDYIKGTLYDSTSIKYLTLMATCKELISKDTTTNNSNTERSQSEAEPSVHMPQIIKSDIKLAPIMIPKFDGSYRTWRSFYDTFDTMINKDPLLSNVHKLHYLKSCVSGEAERLLRQFEITEANYKKAWELLEKRYSNKRVLVQTHLRKLFNQPNIKNESAQAIKNLVDLTEEILHELNTLEINTYYWDPILIYLLVQKLPSETLYLWEREQGGATEIPTYKSFISFLESRFRTLEALQHTHYPQHHHTNKNQVHQSVHKPMHATERQTTSFLTKTNQCLKCKAEHPLYLCPKFKSLSIQHKLEFANKHKLCKNCLSSKHTTKQCVSKFTCYKCHQKHHTILHQEVNTQPQAQTSVQKPTTSEKTQNFLNSTSPNVLLATALVTAYNNNGKTTTLRALIDSGSQVSFITHAAAKNLNLKLSKTNIKVTGLERANTACVQHRTTIKIKSKYTNYKTSLQALVVKNITGSTPTRTISTKHLPLIKAIPLADPKFAEPGPIDLLLGAEIYSSILDVGLIKGKKNTPSMQATRLGWIIMGPVPHRTKHVNSFLTKEMELENLDTTLKRFWESEEIARKPILSVEDELCEEIYRNSVLRQPDGRYQVSLPFKNNQPPILGKSKHIAIKQFFQLEKRFRRQPEYYQQYKECMQEYLELGHMREVNNIREVDSSDENTINHYYLPHHAVIKESTTTKLRVVFNASSKTSNGKSLNEQLLTGPTIQSTLWSTLLNWRQYKFALTADIEKMYRMIKIQNSQQDYQRILWRNNPNEPLKEFVLTTVTFGTTPAPFLAIRTLHQLAHDEKDNFPHASQVLTSNAYVDDLLVGSDSLSAALNLQSELIQLLKKGGFNLRKWTSNNFELLQHLPLEHREIKSDFDISENESIKTLGLKWFPSSDDFRFSVKLPEKHKTFTKRTILSEVASLFDPLGWLAPIIITAKIIIQKLWLLGLEWDKPVPETIQQEWISFKQNLPSIEQIRIPRWTHFSPSVKMELHAFCDASIRAYAAVIYLKVIPQNSSPIITLLTSKSRVAPTKPVTLPRLELCGAVLLSRLLVQVQNDMNMQHIPAYAWTDSMVVLAWIKKQACDLKTYVANRVAEIQEHTSPSIWAYVPTTQNPADQASRGIFPQQIISSTLWWTGPTWLTQTQEFWPVQPQTPTPELEVKKVKSFLVNQEADDIFTKYSTYNKLRRIIAYCLRFYNNCKNKNKSTTNFLTSTELSQAECTIIRTIQNNAFANEIHSLRTKKCISQKSSILNLNPFLDQNSILRVGGRLQNANISYNMKHPILLPKDHFVSKLIIDGIHKLTLHGGMQLVLNTLRTKYWLPNAKNIIKSRIRNCIQCFKNKPKPSVQIMGNLPGVRVNMTLPFQHSGVDFAGPLFYKANKLRRAKLLKCYICLFVCMSTKAIHLEVATDLTSDGFIAAFKRFVSRRGPCSDLYSDCGTNFTGAKKILDQELKLAMKQNCSEIANQLAENSTHWHFNPPSTPHFGGLWEAGVKSVKTHLNKIVQHSTLTLEELSTLLCQIEACVNSRPLTFISSDPTDTECLTPGHFLTGRHLLATPEPELLDDEHLYKRWKFIQQLTQQFWKRWSSEYLHTLQQRSKWLKTQNNISINDIVLIKDERYPPTQWPVGKVLNIHPGSDTHVRVATIKLPKTTCLRPITKLCKLPI